MRDERDIGVKISSNRPVATGYPPEGESVAAAASHHGHREDGQRLGSALAAQDCVDGLVEGAIASHNNNEIHSRRGNILRVQVGSEEFGGVARVLRGGHQRVDGSGPEHRQDHVVDCPGATAAA